MKQRIAKILWHLCKVFLVTLLLMLLIRMFWIESYSVSSSQMETALLNGDKVFVNKTTYGVRMPMTVLAIPFSFDSFFGLKSYSEVIQLKYRRIFSSPIESNEIVVFNNPTEINKPIDRRSICISRCVAKSGDSIVVTGFNYRINGKEYIVSPDYLLRFGFQQTQTDSIKNILATLGIPLREMQNKDTLSFASFNRYEAFLINQNLSDSAKLIQTIADSATYHFVVPKQGLTIEIKEANFPIYQSIIETELNQKVKIEAGKLHINGVPANTYTFLYNYYWFLSDNAIDSIDSRYLGFISEKDIIGKASLIWMSRGKNGFRWDRFFSKVK